MNNEKDFSRESHFNHLCEIIEKRIGGEIYVGNKELLKLAFDYAYMVGHYDAADQMANFCNQVANNATFEYESGLPNNNITD